MFLISKGGFVALSLAANCLAYLYAVCVYARNLLANTTFGLVAFSTGLCESECVCVFALKTVVVIVKLFVCRRTRIIFSFSLLASLLHFVVCICCN